MTKKILLVFPGQYDRVTRPAIPLQLLYLSSILRENGYLCQILDMRLQDFTKSDLNDVLCIGITSMTGQMISQGLKFSRFVRFKSPTIPIIWGGVHPSLLPEQTVENDLVDIVVCGEGELTFLELVQSIEQGKPLDNVKGITFKKNGAVINNPTRNFIDMNSIPIELPYDLIDINKYELVGFPVHTSRGCPSHCSFCYNLSYNRCSYRYKSADRVLNEIEYIVNNFNVRNLSFLWEDNFFVNKKRVGKICEGIIERGLKIEWGAFCRFDYLVRYDDDFLHLIEESGCKELSFGGESGSQRILDSIIHKGVKIEQILEGTRKMSKTQIKQIISFMSGVPTESYNDLKETFDLIDQLVQINPNVEINGIFFYTPYPGTDLMKLVQKEYQFNPPNKLEEWGDYQIYRNVGCTWHEKKYAKMLTYISIMTRFPFFKDKTVIPERFGGFGYKQIYQFLAYSARFRWKHRFFRIPIEWWLLEKALKTARGFV